MRLFRCDRCRNTLFFENVRCLRCGSELAFLPDRLSLCAVERTEDATASTWRRRTSGDAATDGYAKPVVDVDVDFGLYKLCRNYDGAQACNFAVLAHDPNPYCVSCRQTRVLPDLTVAGNRQRWWRIEAAKRKLYFSLAKHRLVQPELSTGEIDGPRFRFLADVPGRRVLTGHAGGVITLNIAEADDDERVRRRIALHEPYRTLLGHLRHESGHFYWDRLIRGQADHDGFRACFGDERADYAQTLKDHYARGRMRPDWQDAHVSAYASAHPWEDWAETWAHYLHMVDLLETAAAYGTQLEPLDAGPIRQATRDPFEHEQSFDELLAQWTPLTLLVNSLNRSLGQDDAYPFALRTGALRKLRHVHDVIRRHRAATPHAGG